MTEGKNIRFTVEELLYLLRRQNHDLLNDFQVVMGYLQIGHLEKGLFYLKKGMKNWLSQRELLRLEQPTTILLLFNSKIEFGKIGIKLQINSNTSLENLPLSETKLNEFLCSILELYKKFASLDEKELFLKIKETEEAYLFQFKSSFAILQSEPKWDFKKRAEEIIGKIKGLCQLSENELICNLPKKDTSELGE